jgi:lipopolysaccharide export system protein LptA
MIRICLVVILLAMAVPSLAQNRVEILRAGQGIGEQTDQGFVRRLKGNVLLRSGETTIACDSAIHYVDKNELYAYGRIRITTKQDVITSRYLFYNTRTEESRLTGGVVITRDSTILRSATADYAFKSETAVFTDPIEMEDGNSTLKALHGTYYAEIDSAKLFGHVQLADSTYYLEADSLFTNRKSESYRLHGRVFLHDRKEDTKLTGAYVEADSTGRRLIRGQALIQQVDSSATDTTFLSAESILVLRDGDHRTIHAVHDVRYWSADYATLSDTLLVMEADSVSLLRGTPSAWHREIHLSGDRIDLRFHDEKLETILATGKPTAAQMDTTVRRLNQMKADTLLVRFVDGEVASVQMAPTGTILVHNKKDDEQPDGAIEMSAARITIRFTDGEASDVDARIGVRGRFLEEGPEVQTFRLPEIRWEPERRPGRPETTPAPRFVNQPQPQRSPS